MKIIKILAGLLLIANMAMAANAVEVHINYPSDSVFIGSYNKLEIWLENDVTLQAIQLGFEVSGTLNAINWDNDYGSIPPANIENDARGAILWQHNQIGFDDTSLPDSFLVGGVFTPGYYNGLQPGSLRECVSLYFHVPEGVSSGQFCVDNIFFPSGGNWAFDDGTGYIPPSFQGCPEPSPYDPACPAVCFPVETTSRPCGDFNADLIVNFSDAIFIINYILNDVQVPVEYVFGDVNCDGRVNVADCLIIMEYIFIGGNAPCHDCP